MQNPQGYPVTQMVQPVPVVAIIPGQPDNWKIGLCGCCEDCGLCCQTYYCPCITFGQTSAMLKNQGCCLPCCLYWLCPFWMACCLRMEIMEKFNIPRSCCGACCTHIWCHCCALIQEHREVKARMTAPQMVMAPVTMMPQAPRY